MERLECVCCGDLYAVKKTGMQLRGGSFLYGDICPECVMRGPKGAARRLGDRLLERDGEDTGALARRLKKDAASLVRLMADKVAALERTESFPLEARQAAARELREKR